MKTERNILIAFVLNISFSILEFIGGIFTNSVAIISDAVHDLGDAISIGISYFLEKKSKKKPDKNYTYGYLRYSIFGATITNTILIVGSILVIYNAILRIINPSPVSYDGMIAFAIFGVVINFIAAYSTRDGDSLNQKAVNLHMLEDVLGWVVVLVGAFIIKFTKFYMCDSIMSILVAFFILINALKSYKSILDLFLEKTPINIDISKLKTSILKIDEVDGVHHIHVWSMDGVNNYATLHIVSNTKKQKKLKDEVKLELKKYDIGHTTIEIENGNDMCCDTDCNIKIDNHHHHHH